ncbi:glycosyltransferase family protein, partial [Desulfovibrio sp.]
DPAGRARLAEAGRRRVLAEHTYDHRLAALLRTMSRTFGTRP